MKYRPLPAGPLTAVEGLQLFNDVITSRYALSTEMVDPFEMADDFLVPIDAVGAPGGGTGSASGQALSVSGAEVSALRRVDGVLELRVFNPRDDETTVEIARRHGWIVDLQGRGISPFENRFTLRAHGIATLRLSER
jgi:hypothetical protein